MDILKAGSTKDYLKCAAVIGLPVVLQNMVSSLINTLDVFMLGQLGEVQITAASVSNQWFLLYCVLANGIAAAAAMFISQYWGQKDREQIHRYMGILFCGSMGLALIFWCISTAGAGKVLRMYSMDPEVIREGSGYLRLMAVCFLLYAVNSTFGTALRSIGQTRVPMAASVLSLGCNALGNYCMIFGHFGFPRMGIRGAAVATVFARIVEISVVLGYLLWKKPPVCGRISGYFKITSGHVRRFFRFGGLVILGEVVYAVGNNLYNVAYKFTGTQSQAALQIIQSIQGIALLFCGGFGTAASVMLGTMLGKNEFERAKRCSKILGIFSMAAAALSAMVVWIAGPVFLQFFQIGGNARESVEVMIKIMACTIPLRTMVFMAICGILRSGGDNLFCFFANLLGVWGVGLPAVFLSAVVFGAPVTVVYLMAALEEAGKLLICGPRVLKGKWLRNRKNRRKAQTAWR